MTAPTKEPNFDDFKWLLRRLEDVAPLPKGEADVRTATTSPQPGALQDGLGGAGPAAAHTFPASPLEGAILPDEMQTFPLVKRAPDTVDVTVSRRSTGARGGLGPIVVAAAVSALLSTGISVIVFGKLLSSKPASTRTALQPHRADETAAIPPPATPEAHSSTPEQAGVLAPANTAPSVNSTDVAVKAAPETSLQSPQTSQDSAATVAPSTKAPVPEPEQILLRGRQMLSIGNVGAARLLLERAAELGNGAAALELAGTYDATLQRPAGAEPDALLARHWYERAAMLGAQDAQQRLQHLDR